MKKNQIGNQSVRIKLFLSYVFFFTLPLLIMGIISYNWLSGITRTQTESSYQNALNSIRESIDRQFGELNKLSVQLSQTGWVKKIMRKDISVEDIDPIALMDYNQELLLYGSTRYFINSIAIYFHNKDLVLSSLGQCTYDYFFTDNVKMDDLNSDKWKSILNAYNSNKMLFPKTLRVHGRQMDGLVYLQSLPVGESGNIRATFMALIDKTVIEEQIENLFIDKDIAVYILDSDKQLVAGKNITDEGLGLLKNQEFFDTDNSYFKNINIRNTQNYILSGKSRRNGWYYFVTVPQKSIMKEVRKVQFIIVILVVVSALMGCLLSYVLALRNSKPLYNLLHLVKDISHADMNDKKLNEYDWLGNAIHTIMEQEKQLKNRIEQDRPTLVNANLMKLLDENSDKEEILKILSLLNIKFIYPLNLCCVTLMKSKNEHCNDDYYEKVLEQIEATACNCGMRMYFAETGDYKVAICNYTDSEQLNEFVNNVKKLFREEKGRISVGVGSSCNDAERLPISYKEALIALDYRLVRGNGSVILYEEAINNKWHYYYPIDKENCIANCLKTGDYNNAISLFKEIMDANIKQEHLNINVVKYFFINAELTALKVAEEVGIRDAVNINNDRLLLCETIEEMKMHIERTYCDICDSVNSIIYKEKVYSNEKMKEDVIHYIDESYTDLALSLTTVADRFGISPSYLSRFFKEQFGSNFLDHINRKRIERAKELLEDQQTDIGKIVEIVGYNNIVTFRRLFRKYEGVSPSQYRDQICKIV